MKNILVTGGAGFIGSNLVTNLLQKNYSVTVIDNLSAGKMENLDSAKSNPNFKFIQGDIRNPKDLEKAMQGADAVAHLAALIDVSASVADPILTHEINVTGTLNVLQEAAKSKIKKVVFASSTAVYGDTKILPVKEDTPFQPISPYAASKVAAEAYCSAFAGCYGLETVRLRFFNVYGPKNENSPYSGVITKFLLKAKQNQPLIIEGDGEQTRDFIHVNDIVTALTLALEAKNASGEAYNVCTGKPITINKLAKTVTEVVHKDLESKHAPPRIGDIRFSYGDPSKAEKKLKFKAKIGIADGLNLLMQNS